jgi:hypothetical protein
MRTGFSVSLTVFSSTRNSKKTPTIFGKRKESEKAKWAHPLKGLELSLSCYLGPWIGSILGSSVPCRLRLRAKVKGVKVEGNVEVEAERPLSAPWKQPAKALG